MTPLPQVRPGEGRPNAPIMLVGEIWGKTEVEKGRPFAGASGIELDRMLHEAGILRSECYATNVVNARPPGGMVDIWIPRAKSQVRADMVQVREKLVAPIVKAGYESLRREIDLLKPRLIIALGDTALWALTGAHGITKWRGSLLNLDGLSASTRVVPTYNPALVLRQWDWRAISVLDLRRAAREYRQPVARPAWHFGVRPSAAQVYEVLGNLWRQAEQAADPLWVEVDLETRAGHIACCGISWTLNDALSIPFMCVEDLNGYWPADIEGKIVWKLRQLLCHRNVRVRWQNGLYDAQFMIKHWHWAPPNGQDTMITHHTLWAELPKSLAFQASMYCDHYVYWKDDGKTWDKNVSEDQLWGYNCTDCVRTRECGEAELAAVKTLGLGAVEEFQQKMFGRVLKVMLRGVKVDPKARVALAAELGREIEKRKAYRARVCGHVLNPASSKQMKAFFYSDLKLPTVWKKNKEGKMVATLDDAALDILKMKEPLVRPLIRSIQEERSIKKFQEFAEMGLDTDGRMRCSYNIAGQDGYRLSSSTNVWGNGGNLQTIPKGGEDDDSDLNLPNMRKTYVPDTGFTMWDGDLSKADLRVVVAESDCREMKAMLREGRDPYIETAREYYRDPTISKYNPDGTENVKYDNFKRFSHGTHYLGTPEGLSKRIGLLIHEATKAQAWYFGKYPAIRRWQEAFKDEIRRTHQVRNGWGYIRHFFGRIDDETFRKAIAWLPQSTVAILINKIWDEIADPLEAMGGEILLQVHDSLVGQAPTDRWAEAKADILRRSQLVIPYPDPLIIPFALKSSTVSWGDCA